jgi:acyl carrier protein
MPIRLQIIQTIEQVARDQEKKLPPITDNLSLLDTNRDSLCLAIIVARLEDILSVDPFSAAEEMEFPTTVGDLIRLYENAVA